MKKKYIALVGCSIVATFAGTLIPLIVSSVLHESHAFIIAHRGYSSKYYENTKQAFEEAGKNSAYWGIETDLYKTKEGRYVCSHDIDPFGKDQPRIIDLTYAELQNYTIDYSHNLYGLKPEESELKGLATFEEYLNICNQYNKVPIVEIKQENFDQADLNTILNEIHDTTKYPTFMGNNHPWIISFNIHVLSFVNIYYEINTPPYSINQEDRCGIQLLDAYDRTLANYFEDNVKILFPNIHDVAISLWYPLIDFKSIQSHHFSEHYVGLFFMNDAIPADDNIITAMTYAEKGVNFITSDFPYILENYGQ